MIKYEELAVNCIKAMNISENELHFLPVSLSDLFAGQQAAEMAMQCPPAAIISAFVEVSVHYVNAQ